MSRSLRPAPSLATLLTDLGTCVYSRVRAQSRSRAVSSASSCGSKGPLSNYLGALRKRRASLPVRSRLIPPCCALRATPSHHLFLTDRCVALHDPRRSRGVASARVMAWSVQICQREPHRLNSVSIAALARQQRDARRRQCMQAIHVAAALAKTAGSGGRVGSSFYPPQPGPVGMGSACGVAVRQRRAIAWRVGRGTSAEAISRPAGGWLAGKVRVS